MSREMIIELVYDVDCPNVEAARDAIREALRTLGARETWTEWNRASPTTPEHLRRFGSPTVLVNSRDVVGDSGADGNSCRVYADVSGRLDRAPSPRLIIAAVAGEQSPTIGA